MTCNQNAIKFVRGNDTNFNGVDFLTINFSSTQLDLSTFKAVFKLSNITKTFNDITEGIIINFSAQETALLPQFCNGVLQLKDSENRIATIESLIPFEVVSVVHGNAIVTEPYEITFDVHQGEMTILNFDVKVAGGVSEFADIEGSPYDNESLANALNSKQDTLVSGENIKTINNQTLLGEGNVETVTSVNSISPVDGNVTVPIPTVNNPTITFTQGGVTKGTITLNQSSDATISFEEGGSSLPTQTGHAGEFLTTDGTDASWGIATKVTIREWS